MPSLLDEYEQSILDQLYEMSDQKRLGTMRFQCRYIQGQPVFWDLCFISDEDVPSTETLTHPRVIQAACRAVVKLHGEDPANQGWSGLWSFNLINRMAVHLTKQVFDASTAILEDNEDIDPDEDDE